MRYSSLIDLLKDKARLHGSKIALIFDYDGGKGKEILTYSELLTQVNMQVDNMKKQPFSCVGIKMHASPQWIITALAAAIAGKQTVLMDPDVSQEKAKLMAEATDVEVIYTEKGSQVTQLGDNILYTKNSPIIQYPGDFLFFTSGTTGANKAVVVSQEAVLSSAWKGNIMMECKEEDVLLSVLPLNHIFGFVCALLWPISSGATVAIGRGLRFLMDDPLYFKPTIISVVPAMLKFMLSIDCLNPELTALLVGAGPCDKDSLDKVRSKGIDLRYGYGLTETASGLAISLKGENPFDMAICPETEIRISDRGEIIAKSSSMMKGYYKDPEKTSKVLIQGELHTGDLGKLVTGNRLNILGRLDDVYALSSGEKIKTGDWEDQLTEYVGVPVKIKVENDTPIPYIYVENPELKPIVRQKIIKFNSKQPLGRRLGPLVFTHKPIKTRV